MSFKTILLHLGDPRRARRLLEASIPLARQTGAHLVGLTVLPPFIVIPAFDATGGSVMVDDHRIAYKADMARLKELFATATAGQPLQSEWREGDAKFGTAAQMLIEHGRTADLIMASQRDPDWVSSDLLEDPVRLAMESGRPLLLIPNQGPVKLPAKRITVAWNGRREAARTVFDALPLLKLADEVSVLWINPEKEQERAGDLPGAELCATLARHGVRCEAARATAAGVDVGGEIMRLAGAFGSQMLVMGCYGHTRLREFILGGASRDILARMSIPVLMSH